MSYVSSSLPEDWTLSTLGEEFKWGSGGTPKSDNLDYYDGDIPWVVSGQLNDSVIVETAKKISHDGMENSSAKWVREGSILIAMYGATIGKLGIAGKDLTTNQAIAFTYPEHVDERYLFWFLRSIRSDLSALGKGGAQPNISQTVIKSIPFPMAPRNEQKQIVEVIETQFARLDDAVAALKRAQTRLKRYRASVLKAASEGTLVPTEAELARKEDRSYEPASVLLQRIAAEQEAAPGKKRGKAKASAPLDTSHLPELPEGWAWTTIAKVNVHLTSGSRDWSKYYGSGTGTFILAQNVRPGALDLTYRQAVNPPINDRDRKRSQVEQGDLLITIVGANTGDVCPVKIDLPEHYVCQSVALIRPALPALTPFAMLYLMSEEHGQKQFERFMYGQGRPHLSFDQLRSTTIALPPLAEQERIVEEVERRLSVIEQMEATVETNLKRAESLRQSILRLAFSGRLLQPKAGNTV